MEVIVMESEAFKKLEQMYANAISLVERLAIENINLRINLLTVKEVAGQLKYDRKTILNRKEEIGYVQTGKEIRFEPSKVQDWIKRNSIKPKVK